MWLFGAVGASAASGDQEELLTARVNKYWGHKIKRDFEKTYPYETPEYRQGVDLSEYRRSFGPGVKWLGAAVEKVTFENGLAKVRVKIRYRWTMVSIDGPVSGFTGIADENWRMEDGVWYHVKNDVSVIRTKGLAPKQE